MDDVEARLLSMAQQPSQEEDVDAYTAQVLEHLHAALHQKNQNL